MEERIITFTANEQGLVKTGGISHYASDTISYIKAVFTLGENWQGFDEVRAVFKSPYECRPAVLDSNGECYVPVEVLFYKGKVKVNLVGSIVTETEVTDRLTTYSVEALDVDEDVPICGEESQPISPSEYEQFVAKVANDANRASQSATDAETYADEAEASAQNASESASASAVSASDSARSATASEGYAQNASESAQSAENAKDDAEDARDEILGMRATAETLEAGSDATASYSDGLLTLGIPRGDQGIQGIQGETGATPNLTIGTVETLEPTEDATATITGTAENPVLNLGLPKGDTGEVSLEDLEALLPTDTASGDIVTIPDGQSVISAESLKVALEPIQDLNGYDHPWPAGGGKNKVPFPYATPDGVYSGVTFTTTGEKIVASGKTNNSFAFTLATATLPAGNYVMSVDGTHTNAQFRARASGTNLNALNPANSYVTFTLESESEVTFDLVRTASAIDLNTHFQVESGSTPTAWNPYSNICPISGHTECVTEVCGTNVWDEEWEVGTISTTTGQNASNNTLIRSTNYIPCTPSTQYYPKAPSGTGGNILFYDADKNYISYVGMAVNYAFTTPSNAHYMRFRMGSAYGTTYNHDISINYPSTDHDYHAYNGDTYTTTLGRTVYGGTLDVVSGELVVDRVAYTFDGTETWVRYSSTAKWYTLALADAKYESGVYVLSDKFNGTESGDGTAVRNDYDIWLQRDATYKRLYVVNSNASSASDMQALTNGATVVYPIATPQTIQLTPQEVKLLLGTNNVWSDGSVTLVYSADIQKWVEKQLNGNSTTLTMSRPMVQTETETE